MAATATETFAKRKRQELATKLASLGAEFATWRAESAQGNPLEKHQSQIWRVTAQLASLQEEIDRKLVAADGNLGAVIAGQGIERDILEIHRIWEFFRAKLALRYVSWFSDYLAAADELAWVCYAPACRFATAAGHISEEGVKEPPLVFFNGGSSPFTMPRRFAFQAEEVPGEALRREPFREVLDALPIPVLGIPWFQVAHLPDAVAIGHEVGHLVENDLDLTERLRRVLEGSGVAAERLSLWRGWLGEVFADLWGVLATGPAFVSGLIDFLAGDPGKLARERQDASKRSPYPTTHLRILLNLCALDELGLGSGELASQWRAVYGDTHAMAAYATDLGPVVKALLMTKLPELDNHAISEVLPYAVAMHQRAVQDAGDVLTGREPTSDDIRGLIGAARLAFEMDPETYREKDAQRRILDRFVETKASGPRASAPRRSPEGETAQNEHDLRAGAQLLAAIKEGRTKRSGGSSSPTPARAGP